MSVMPPLLAKCLNSDCDIQRIETLVFKGTCRCLSNFAFLFGFETPVRNQQTCMHMFFWVFLALFVLTCVL